MKKTISNLFYNSLYQVLILFIPLLTIPYVARVLGANGVGVNALVTSVANFLGTIIVMGMYQLGAREVAKANKSSLRIVFLSLWKIQIIAGICVIFVYTMVITFLIRANQLYYFLEIPFLISYILDISWFFVGIGQIKKVILRNTFIKILSLILIFMFVNSKNDLWIYVLVLSGTNCIANLMFLFNLKTTLPRREASDVLVTRVYVKVAIMLLLPQIALQLYTNLDDVIVGAIAGNSQLAYYDQSQKIARIIVTILTSMSTVLMPKMASSKDDNSLKKLFNVSLNYTLIVALFFTSLLMVNSSNFVNWYYGDSFASMANNMYWVSLIVIFISYGGVFSNQYMLAKGQYKRFSLPYYLGGILNILLNVVFVSTFSANGGTFSLVVTEGCICISRLYLTRNEINLKNLLSKQAKYLYVFLITTTLGTIFPVQIGEKYFFSIVVQSVISSIIFLTGLFVFKTDAVKDLKALKVKIKQKNRR